MEAMLHARFGLDHTTLQVDHVGGDLLEIEPAGETPHGAADGAPEKLNETRQRQDRR
jgi:hypothetical protein